MITIGRSEFIRRYMKDLGVTYAQAQKIYETTMMIIEDAVITNSRIGFGRVGALTPIKKQPRMVNMGFAPGGKQTDTKTQHVYWLGQRVDFKFRIYRTFLARRGHEWFPKTS